MRRRLLIVLAASGILLSPHAVGAAEAPVEVGEPRPLPALAFQDMEGAETTLAAFTGKVVVLNLWATSCAPCREEMPSLDRLQARFEDQPVVVLALSVDRAGPERVRAFLDEVGVRHLRVYRTGVEREAGLVEQLVAPVLRARSEEARTRATEKLRELATLSAQLHTALLEARLRELLRP